MALDVKPHCRGTRKDGSPCHTTLGLSPDGLCIAHDPERIEESRAMRLAGAKESAARSRARKEAKKQAERDALAKIPGLVPAPKSVDDAMRALSWLYFAGASGLLDSALVRECSNALNRYVAAVDKAVLEKKLAQYREALGVARSCSACGAKVAALLAGVRK